MRPHTARRPWTRPLLLILLVAELVAASFALRSATFLAEPLTSALGRLGERLGGQFHYTAIAPEGLTGIKVLELAFYPAGRATPAATVDTVRIYPDLAGLLGGHLSLDQVELEGAELWVDEALLQAVQEPPERHAGDSGAPTPSLAAAVQWLQALDADRIAVHLRQAQLPGGGVDVELRDVQARPSAGAEGPRLALLADVRVQGGLLGRLSAEWPESGSPHARIDVDPGFAWEPWLAGLGFPSGARLHIGAIELAAGPLLALDDTALEGLGEASPRLGDWYAESAQAARIEVRPEAGGLAVAVERGTLAIGAGGARAAIPVRRVDFHSGRQAPLTDLTVVLGDADGGRAEVRLEAPPEGELPTVSIDAHDYDIAPWAPLMGEDLPVRLQQGHFSGTLSLSWEPESGQIRAAVDGALARAAALAPFLAVRRLEAINVGLQGDVTIDVAHQSLDWERGRLTLAGIPVAFTTRVGWSEAAPRFELDADLADVPAEQLRRGLPRGLAPSLEGVALSGTLSASLHVRLDETTPEASALDVDLDLSGLAVDSLGPALPVAELAGDFRLSVTGEDGQVRSIGPDTPTWVPLDQVSTYLTAALVSAEDGSFWTHDGFDWAAIQHSVELNLREGRIVRGGSTISQQVVRTLFLGHERTLGRKLEEAFLTWQLEQMVSKQRILELYVNAVHWGPGIQGVREAARTYFRRTADQLTLSESAFLASILPNPDYFGLQYARHIVSPSRREKICNILHNMYNGGAIEERQYQRDCSAVEDGVVSIVPVPSWLVDFAPAPDPSEPTVTAQLD